MSAAGSDSVTPGGPGSTAGPEWTPRQQREIEYHHEHAQRYANKYDEISWELVTSARRRWWNQAWVMYSRILELDLAGKKVLVVGCGFGDDAFQLARLGAEVHAFDISPDVLRIAEQVSEREGLSIRFARMAAESLEYADGLFDCVVMRDILHHVELVKTLAEIRRVAVPGAVAVINEVYSHSFADRIRHSRLVSRHLYGRMVKVVYGDHPPYVTADERKLDEAALALIQVQLERPVYTRYFDLMVNRVLPNSFPTLSKLDYLALRGLGSLGRFFGGRVLLVGRLARLTG